MERASRNDGKIFERRISMANDMPNSGFCSLIVRGDNLDLDLIEKTLNLEASDKWRKGEIINDIVGEMEDNFIRFNEKLDGKYNPNKTLQSLINKLMNNKSFLEDLNKKAYICLVCYIQSDYAMIGYTLSVETLNMIVQLGVDLDISILSWGGVKDDGKKKKKRRKNKS